MPALPDQDQLPVLIGLIALIILWPRKPVETGDPIPQVIYRAVQVLVFIGVGVELLDAFPKGSFASPFLAFIAAAFATGLLWRIGRLILWRRERRVRRETGDSASGLRVESER